MSSLKIRIPLFVLLAWVIQFAWGLTDRQFIYVLVLGLAMAFIVVGLTHSDEVPADEASEKVVNSVKKMVKKGDDEDTLSPKKDNENQGGSGYKPPKVFS